MAVAEMQKLNLAAMSYDRDAILNALQKTGATEIKHHYDAENTAPLLCDFEKIAAYLARIEGAIEILSAEIGGYNKENKIKSDELKDGFSVSYADFISAKQLKEQADALTQKVYALCDERKGLLSELNKLEREISAAEIYSPLTAPFASYSATKHAQILLGTVSADKREDFFAAVEKNELFAVEELCSNADLSLVACAWHISFDGGAYLAEYGFAECPFKDGTGESNFKLLNAKKNESLARLDKIKGELCVLEKQIKPAKIYCDFVAFELEKAELSQKMRKTAKTFLLEAYVPAEAVKNVTEALDSVSRAVYYEFGEPNEDEMPPTLYKNNEVVKNFEAVTNMYSPVNAREFDPNAVMAVFYSIFLGFIMADIGYGLLMFFGGGFIYMKNRRSDSGLKRLSGVFAIGGIFAIVWGLLFGSLFGFTIFTPVMPNAQSDMWHFLGIRVPAVLVISLIIGVVHLTAGYICKAIQCMRRGYFWDGILDGLVWTVFSVGIALAIVGLIDEAEMPLLAYIGGGTAGVCLVIAIFTAGRKEKLLGKFTKGFGAAYGIINYASDILSYARLYGLMLSGAVIAQIISTYSAQFIQSGNAAFIILAVILMIVGHAFNLAIGLLGAYIHDARLQYVEFYGRFYEGEGELFAPLGSKHKFIKIENPAL